MDKSRNIKAVDIIIIIIAILLAILVFFSLTRETEITGDPVEITIQIPKSESSDVIYNKAVKTDEVYLNSTDIPVKVLNVEQERNGRINITLSGKGQIDSDRYIFNGKRVLIGQKAEIHGIYFAKGIIKDVKEDN